MIKYPEKDTELQKAMTNEIWKILEVSNYCKNYDTAIFAGGAVGDFPIKASVIFKNIFTFEPSSENFELLSYNIRSYDNIRAYSYALYNKHCNGKVEIPKFESENNFGTFTFIEDEFGPIKTVTLDWFKFEEVDLIYLDIEGAELKALEGAKDTIERCKPVIVIENKGLIPGYGGDFNGSEKVREEIINKYNYKYVKRLMRDDVFIPA